MYFYVNVCPPSPHPKVEPHPTPGDHDFYKFESTLPENPQKFFSFLADRVLRKDFFFYKFLYTCMYSYIKIQLLLWPKPTPGDHYFHKRESALLENAFTKVSAFLSD